MIAALLVGRWSGRELLCDLHVRPKCTQLPGSKEVRPGFTFGQLPRPLAVLLVEVAGDPGGEPPGRQWAGGAAEVAVSMSE